METQELKARIFDVKTFYRHLKNVVSHFKELRDSKKRDNVSKKFSEKIMLAVTQVNGCRYCNYLHTKNLIDKGTCDEDINSILNGEPGRGEKR